ncbi:hypothetical protein RRG08_035760 [Elysia crispata]|uniref:Uncharacterized protein n=1 Tax=Elysia crispata TaxID=231223 RepID=A0AAE1DI82_9GAST|nr:hypothetical protein RRG08_035760 [Elysia crispata]
MLVGSCSCGRGGGGGGDKNYSRLESMHCVCVWGCYHDSQEKPRAAGFTTLRNAGTNLNKTKRRGRGNSVEKPGGASDMTSPGAAASAAEAHQPVRCQWPNDQDAHFHHARRFQPSPLIPTYFKWPKADNAHDHGLGLGPHHDGLHPTNLTDHLHRSSSNNNINGGNNNNNHNDNSNTNGGGGGGGGGGANGNGGGGGGINYARTTSSGSLSGPPTPTGGLGPGSLGSGGPNTPLVVPQPVKPPSSRAGGVKTYQCKICDQVGVLGIPFGVGGLGYQCVWGIGDTSVYGG